jgi:hypothetical protein
LRLLLSTPCPEVSDIILVEVYVKRKKERKKERKKIPGKEGNLKDIDAHVRYTILYFRGGYLRG